MASTPAGKWKFVKPSNASAIIRNPQAGYTPLPPTGAWVSKTPFWMARIEDKSVTVLTTPQYPQTTTPAAASEPEQQ